MPHHAPLHILQHPTEVGHPKGTAALLVASLSHARIHVGEDFEGDEGLNALLAYPDVQCYLLWPDDEALTPLQARAHLARRAGQGKASAHFILLDGTWRKAYRMLHRNPALLGLPRITLGAIAGQYSIRKSPFPGALSTLEAGYHLLSQWEGDAERFAPLMELFTHLNRQWHEFADGRRR